MLNLFNKNKSFLTWDSIKEKAKLKLKNLDIKLKLALWINQKKWKEKPRKKKKVKAWNFNTYEAKEGLVLIRFSVGWFGSESDSSNNLFVAIFRDMKTRKLESDEEMMEKVELGF